MIVATVIYLGWRSYQGITWSCTTSDGGGRARMATRRVA